ncbi:kinase-like domain-containing protein [Paraphoma chrysanthemicola]|uniref:Kinase-like domain-containing protein n=1 Tax=Paraphoma chrysanthemicola TaxID=798071 RepID=A0A8K0RJI4_9PLEO|nr:kinase-like domain-containing protein [Paraphoma chrysanthemicola]
MPPTISQHGLKWKRELFGDIEPSWTVEPDVEALTKLVRDELNVRDDTAYEVKFLAQGAFNKVYTIQIGNESEIKHISRVCLPVQPCFKTMSEVATTSYIRHHTDIPAPNVWASNASNEKDLGFEWTIQDYVNGRKLDEAWKEMSWLEKELLIWKVIHYLTQLFATRFNRLGNLYATKDLQQLTAGELPDAKLLGSEHSTPSEGFCVSQVVSMPFFWGKRVSSDVPRGPFSNSRDWFATQIQLALIDLDVEYDDSDSDSDSDDEHPMHSREAVTHRANRILALLPTIFPENEPEQFVLHHNDLNANNILVDSNSSISGIIDWELVHTVPLSIACQMPKFLEAEMDRHKCPSPDDYGKDTDDNGNTVHNEMYFRHLDEHEKTRLWAFFREEMGRGKLQAGLEDVVTLFGHPWHAGVIDQWLDKVEKDGFSENLQDLARARQRWFDAGCPEEDENN